MNTESKRILTPPEVYVRRDGDPNTTRIEKLIADTVVFIDEGVGVFSMISKRATYPIMVQGDPLLLASYLEEAAKELRNAASSQ